MAAAAAVVVLVGVGTEVLVPGWCWWVVAVVALLLLPVVW